MDAYRSADPHLQLHTADVDDGWVAIVGSKER